ncbi:hypothetical protein TSOC_005609, partial [Tetrabaena socialis]
VSHLRSTYRQQAGKPWHERSDDAAFRAGVAMPGRLQGGGSGAAQDDEYE